MKSLFIVALIIVIVSCSGNATSSVKPLIKKQIPHSRSSFTQGFFLKEGKFYEGTGLYGKSALNILDATTGKNLYHKKIPQEYFGEGITYLDSHIYQLTWKKEKALVYRYPDLTFVKEVTYVGQGWGLTTRDSQLIMSNGSDTLYFMSKDFSVLRKVAVTHNGKKVKYLNELEFARGKIYANVWHSSNILEINPQSGNVTKIVNCKDMIAMMNNLGSEDVLNGIAYDENDDVFYLTGKNWPYIFIVTIP